MKNITIEIAEKYASVITISVAGHKAHELNVATSAFDLNKIDKITVDENGKITASEDTK